MKRLDIIIIAVVLVVAGGLYFSGILSPGEKGGEAVVYVDGEEKARYSLSENITDTIETENGEKMTFEKPDIALIRLAFDF